MKLRKNDDMTLTVVGGVMVDSLLGSKTAWAYLAANGVPTPTILRVLISQARRRATDPIYAVDDNGTIIWRWLPPQASVAVDCVVNTSSPATTEVVIFPEDAGTNY